MPISVKPSFFWIASDALLKWKTPERDVVGIGDVEIPAEHRLDRLAS